VVLYSVQCDACGRRPMRLQRLKFTLCKMSTVAVIGAGISGLSTAYYLSKINQLKVTWLQIFISMCCSVKVKVK